MNRKKLRLQFLGDKHYQWHTVMFFLSSIMFSGLLVLMTAIAVLLKSAQPEDIFAVFGGDIINKIILCSTAALSVFIFIALFMVLIYSNKIAGPLQRLKLYLHDMINGDFQKPLKFRADDEFKDLTSAVNVFREKLLATKATSKKSGLTTGG